MPSVEEKLELETKARQSARWVLTLSLVVTVPLYVWPQGRIVAYPLVLISTLAHEMGHGISAALMGGRFESFQMWADGSGVALTTGVLGRLASAVVSAGGLIGPAFAAALCFALGKRPKRAAGCLFVLGAVLLVALFWVVRNLFGGVFVGVLGATAVGLAIYAPAWVSQMALVFVAVQLSLSVFSRGDYLFTAVAQTSAGPMPSDVAQMAEALLLPFWFWGALCALVSLAVLGFGLKQFWR